MSDYNFAIESKNLNKTYIKKNNLDNRALINLNIQIPTRSIYGLLGPNGAGKSTFINILGGLVKKNSGEVKICDVDIDNNPKLSKKKIGIVPQELNIDPFFTPIELLELQAGLYGVSKKNRRSEYILSKVGLLDQKNSYARTLSGGMRRRLLIAKALVHDPEIIILDEPTAGVDVELRQGLWRYIKELNNNGKTICLTTHYLEEAEYLCDYITIINNGKILKSDTKNNLINLIGKKIVKFSLNCKINKIPQSFNKYNPILNENILSLTYDKNLIKLKSILDELNAYKITFDEINTYENDLEDIFIDLIRNND
ncbi:ABC transporter ATP-binding protein [Alphaproteobacteria bacterium]|nr:ABC transporter ATP-binding protein [Alphaproteobacteria bacterium]